MSNSASGASPHHISPQQFLVRQPSFPEPQTTDPWYHALCNRIMDIFAEHNLLRPYPVAAQQRLAITIVGYYQDIISDAGLWRAFINENKRFYGHWLPFFEIEEEGSERYVEYELNRADVRWLTWYALSMNYEPLRICSPEAPTLLEAADAVFELLETEYDGAPDPVGYNLQSEIDMHDPADRDKMFRLANWLFMYSYLLTPAFALTLSEISASLDSNSEDFMVNIQKKLDEAMNEQPTGPLALYLAEWMHLVLENKPLSDDKKGNDKEPDKEVHPTWIKFTSHTGGEPVKFFGSYEELNDFFINVLGWNPGEEHLPQVKGAHDYVLLVDKYKGMLLARDVARCIKCDLNPWYDAEFARKHSIELLTVRGACPCDLLHYICRRGWLSDACFPGSNNHELVKANYDFIARCYLQQYYRD